MLYTIEDTTLNGLANAIRDKSGHKRISGLSSPNDEPFYTIQVDTSSDGWRLYDTELIYRNTYLITDFLGDRAGMAKSVYYSLECETNDLSAFTIYFTVNSSTGAMKTYNLLTDGVINKNTYIPLNSRYLPEIWIRVPQDKINSGITGNFTIKLWACDENQQFIGTNRLTPLEMIDKINNDLPYKYIYDCLIYRPEVTDNWLDFEVTEQDLKGYTQIGKYAFADMKNLTAITFPEGITTISAYAFNGCANIGKTSNNELVLPRSLEKMENACFSSLIIKTVRILNNNNVIDVPTTLTQHPFYACNNITTFYVPSNLYNDYCNDIGWNYYKDKFSPVGEWIFDPVIKGSLLFNQSKEYSIPLNDFDYTPEFSITSSNPEIATVSDIAINEDNSLITFKVNSLTVEGNATINISINSSIKIFEFSGKITVYESLPESTYEVVPVDGATYGFALNDAGYWESQNQKIPGSYALCQINISNMVGRTVYLDCINFAESNYDYGLLGSVNQVLGKNANDDSGVKQSFKGKQSPNVVTVEYADAIGECFIQVKFRKDSSGDKDNDSIQFKVRFGD